MLGGPHEGGIRALVQRSAVSGINAPRPCDAGRRPVPNCPPRGPVPATGTRRWSTHVGGARVGARATATVVGEVDQGGCRVTRLDAGDVQVEGVLLGLLADLR